MKSAEDQIVDGLQPPYDTAFEVIVARFKSEDMSPVGKVPGFGCTAAVGTRKLEAYTDGTEVENIIRQMRVEIQHDLELLIKQNARLKEQRTRYGIGIFRVLPAINGHPMVRYAKVTA